MDRNMRRSGWMLAGAGIVGGAFFWITDPRFGLVHGETMANLVEASNEAMAGTVVGIVGSVVVLLIGVWLMTRRVA